MKTWKQCHVFLVGGGSAIMVLSGCSASTCNRNYMNGKVEMIKVQSIRGKKQKEASTIGHHRNWVLWTSATVEDDEDIAVDFLETIILIVGDDNG